eukprot:2702150-Amphidinium_carterae.1
MSAASRARSEEGAEEETIEGSFQTDELRASVLDKTGPRTTGLGGKSEVASNSPINGQPAEPICQNIHIWSARAFKKPVESRTTAIGITDKRHEQLTSRAMFLSTALR